MKFIISEPQRKKLIEGIIELAKNYSKPRHFALAHPKLWQFLKGQNMIDVAFPDRQKYKPDNYWTVDTITQESKKYESRGEFRIKNQWAYEKARKLGILDELFPKIVKVKEKPIKKKDLESQENYTLEIANMLEVSKKELKEIEEDYNDIIKEYNELKRKIYILEYADNIEYHINEYKDKYGNEYAAARFSFPFVKPPTASRYHRVHVGAISGLSDSEKKELIRIKINQYIKNNIFSELLKEQLEPKEKNMLEIAKKKLKRLEEDYDDVIKDYEYLKKKVDILEYAVNPTLYLYFFKDKNGNEYGQGRFSFPFVKGPGQKGYHTANFGSLSGLSDSEKNERIKSRVSQYIKKKIFPVLGF